MKLLVLTHCLPFGHGAQLWSTESSAAAGLACSSRSATAAAAALLEPWLSGTGLDSRAWLRVTTGFAHPRPCCVAPPASLLQVISVQLWIRSMWGAGSA